MVRSYPQTTGYWTERRRRGRARGGPLRLSAVRQVLLLRAVNVGARRVAMPVLREVLSGAGLQDVRTHLQTGNVVVTSDAQPERLAADCRSLISHHFGFDVPVIVRTATELEHVVALDPLGRVATEPRRYWVSFLEGEVQRDWLERLGAIAAGDEQVEGYGRELYAWLPRGGGRSKLGAALAKPARGVTGTVRNWLTVSALHELVNEGL
jgi:uncharacterized protein (DUF1697 family)